MTNTMCGLTGVIAFGRHYKNFLTIIFCFTFALLSACQEENPWSEFEARIESNEPIPPKKYDDGTYGYVFYQKEFGSNLISKWLIRLPQEIYISSDGESKEVGLQAAISPNSTLYILFDAKRLIPLTKVEVQRIEASGNDDVNSSLVIVQSKTNNYVSTEELEGKLNKLPQTLLIPESCIIGDQVELGIFNLTSGGGNEPCYNSGPNENFYITSSADNFHARASCRKTEENRCVIYVHFDFNRTAQIFISKDFFSEFHLIINNIYIFLQKSTLAIDDIILGE